TASAAAFTLRLLGRRILELTSEIDDLNTHIAAAIEARAPQLLQRYGVGPDTAAALLLVAGDNPERLNSEASFAALCGVSPIEASSGKTHRRRLNRGGDRQANSALYTITIARLRWDKRTQNYVQRRVAEGKTRREAIRCLKRYIAREIYRYRPQPRSTSSTRSRHPTDASGLACPYPHPHLPGCCDKHLNSPDAPGLVFKRRRHLTSIGASSTPPCTEVA
ncbi:MAG: transposase, partial [Streptosporangiaceae bacterium]|nr:transposase [Streptosporangiaceae bacterium]